MQELLEVAADALGELPGYVGVALAGIITGYAAAALGARDGLLLFGLIVVLTAILLTQLWVKETLPWAHRETARVPNASAANGDTASGSLTTWAVFSLMSWRDRRMGAISQAGLVEKFVDALVWVFYPVFLFQRGWACRRSAGS